MANPSSNWDKVPIFGWYMELDGVTPKVGQIKLTLGQRVNTQSSFHTTFPGGTVTATIGDASNTTVVNTIRAAMSAVDQAAIEGAGGTFDAAAWGAAWDAALPSAFFTEFPASDDPDIITGGYEVKVEEKLTSGDGKIYYITPLLSDLQNAIPGVNLGLIDVPPGSPTAPAPIYQKGQPGGVASLDSAGLVPLEQLPADIGGGAVDSVNDQVGVVTLTPADVGAVPTTRTVASKPLSADVVLVKGDVGLSAVDNTADANKPLSTAATTALAAKADSTALTSHTGNTSNPHAVTKAQVGLSAVDNTADVSKPVSTAQATAIGLKADTTALTSHTSNVSNPHAVTKTQVGLANVDNTSDVNKPISTLTQTALDATSQDVLYNGTSWATARASAVVRRFISTGFPSAPAPTGLSGADLWFRDKDAT